ncbi:universal stress protein, partial [Xanthovirga aplysinae]|uniref:universal stress protein n=1 Tax=Xanthovirga aplysinae TaxID=2529853 RepID=UPI001656DEE8
EKSHKESVDLIVVGRKSELKGSGVTIHRLARRADCSILFVPENFQPQKLTKILVPSDFSERSKNALARAINIAKKNDATIICQNVYKVPVGYHYTGKSYEEFALIMENNARREYEKFISSIDSRGVPIQPNFSLDKNDNPSNAIYQMSEDTKAQLIVIGAKGQTATAAIFIGSTAERLVKHNFRQPLLMVRAKGKNVGLMDYIIGREKTS